MPSPGGGQPQQEVAPTIPHLGGDSDTGSLTWHAVQCRSIGRHHPGRKPLPSHPREAAGRLSGAACPAPEVWAAPPRLLVPSLASLGGGQGISGAKTESKRERTIWSGGNLDKRGGPQAFLGAPRKTYMLRGVTNSDAAIAMGFKTKILYSGQG